MSKINKNIFFIIFVMSIISILLMFLTTNVYAAEEKAYNNSTYIVDDSQKVSQYNIDLINNVGKELDDNNIKLLLSVYNRTNTRVVPEDNLNNIYYYVLGKEKNKDIIIINYYIEENKIYLMQNKKIIKDKEIVKIEQSMKNYIKNDDINDGVIYIYNNIADNIAKQKNIKLVNIKTYSQNKYKNTTSFKEISYIFAITIIIILLFAFKKKKN